MLVVDQRDGSADHVAQQHLLDLRRLQCIGDQDHRIIAPTDDVDPLASQLAGHVFNPVASHAHTSPNAIDALIGAADGYLAAIPRLAADRVDLDDPFGNLRNLLLEQPLDQGPLGPRKDDLDAVSCRLDFINHCAHSGPVMISFPGNLLIFGQNRFDIPKLDDRKPLFGPLHDAGNKLPDLLMKLLESRVALGLFELLDNHLLGRLSTDPTDLVLAKRLAIDRRVDRTDPAHDVDVDHGLLTKLSLRGGDQCRLDRLHDQFRVDLLFSMQGIDNSKQILGIHAVFFRLMVEVWRPKSTWPIRESGAGFLGSLLVGQGYT